jgi:hypothetical protein
VGTQKISGSAVFDLSWKDGRLVAVGENDHILRRFGQVDVVRLAPEYKYINHRVGSADEIWVLIEGQAKLVLSDLRDESPTKGIAQEISLTSENPQAVLIPFGTRAKITSLDGAALLRITSHADELFPDDHIFRLED